MDINNAIDILYAMKAIYKDAATLHALEIAIDAMRKQDGKRPVPVRQGSTWSKCPVCGDTYIDEYCGKCGQKIDWSEEQEVSDNE